MHPGKSEEELAAFMASLNGREKVRLVCIDLSSPYRRLVRKWFPRAKIVADRFDAVRRVYQHCVQLMRAIAPQIRNWRGSLAALRKAPEKLTPEQRLKRDRIFEQHPAVKAIYQQMHAIRILMKHKKQSKNNAITEGFHRKMKIIQR